MTTKIISSTRPRVEEKHVTVTLNAGENPADELEYATKKYGVPEGTEATLQYDEHWGLYVYTLTWYETSIS